MGRFSGPGGALYAVAEPFHFTASPLEDRGDGWSWRLRDRTLRQIVGELEVEIAHLDGWQPVEATVLPPAGVVSLPRCARGRAVRASGIACPLSLLTEAESWELEIEVAFSDPGSMGDQYRIESRYIGAAVRLHGCTAVPAGGYVRVEMPFVSDVFVGFGHLQTVGAIATVNLDERGASYGPV